MLCHAEEILLQCKVSGKYNEEQIQPATVLATIIKQGSYLYIDIDGPAEYELGVSTRSSETENRIYFGRDDSSENTFAIHNEVTKKDGTLKTIYDVKINRVTGLLSAQIFFVRRHGVSNISYSGTCVISSNKKRF